MPELEKARYCQNCGTFRCYADVLPSTPDDPDGTGEIEHCIDCPPEPCEWCGKMSSAREPCSCWIPLAGMSLADQNALFALGDLSLDQPKSGD